MTPVDSRQRCQESEMRGNLLAQVAHEGRFSIIIDIISTVWFLIFFFFHSVDE